MSVPVISVHDVSKIFTVRAQKSLKETLVNARRGRAHFDRFRALDNVSLEISSGESVGLVGPNGSGKSTLLKVIGGILAPDSGVVRSRGRIAALLELGAGFHPDLTGRENIYLNASVLGLSTRETSGYFNEIVEFADIGDFIDTQVKFYSSGMYVRLGFSVAVHLDPDILLLDEILAVGDEPFQAKCIKKIADFRQDGRTILFVSHSSAQVAATCDRAIVLEHGQILEDDVPAVALDRLAREYRRYVDDQAQLASGGVPGGAAKIEAVTIREPGEPPKSVQDIPSFLTGSDVEICVHIAFSEPQPKWGCLLEVEGVAGGRVLQLTTAQLNASLPPADGPVQLCFGLPQPHWGTGGYVVNAIVLDATEEELTRAQRACTFSVKGSELSSGALSVAASVAVVSDEA